MELRQLRYFVTLAEELHFGRAAAREHIVQSALSQQVQRLERELGVRLLERSTHHVSLTAAGAAFLAEARQILAHTDRAAAIARSAAGAAAALRVGIIDASYDSMPQILHQVQAGHPGLVIHQVEASVPEQYRQLADGRLDVGIGRAANAPPGRLPPVPPRPAGGPSPARSPARRPGGHPRRRPGPRTALARRRNPSARIQPVHRRDVPGRRLHPHRARGHRGKHSRRRRPGRPGTLPVLRAIVLHLRTLRHHLAAAHRTSLLLPVVGAMARCRHLRPGAGPRQLCPSHVPPPRLARHSGADRALTSPNTVRPAVTSLRRAVTTARSDSKCPLLWSRRRRPFYGRRFR